MESRSAWGVPGDPRDAVNAADRLSDGASISAGRHVADLLDSDAEKVARERLFDEVLVGVELVLEADGVAFWREEPDHSLHLTSSRSMSRSMLHALDRTVTTPLQSIMQRWPDSPLAAVPLNDPSNAIAEDIRAICEVEGVSSLAGVPCRLSGEMLGLMIVIHRHPHSWTVRDLGLATGFAGQLATAMQNAHLYASVRSLASRLTAIHELSLRLAQLRDVDAIGEAIVAEVGRLVDCDTVRVYRLDPDEGVFRPVAASGRFMGIDSPPLEALSSGHGETLPGWVAKRNEPLIIPDASVERRSIFRSTFGPESLLLVPMSYGNVVQGVLAVSKEGIDRYGPDDEQALSIFGRYAAQAIVNADNVERLERQQALLERQIAAERRLLDVSEQLVSTLEPRRVLEQIADTIGSVVRFDQLTIYRLDRKTGKIEAVVDRSGEAEGSPTLQPAMDEGLTSWVIGRGDAVCANDVGEGVLAIGPDGLDERDDEQPVTLGKRHGRGAGAGQATQNIIVVPLRTHGEVVGSLNLMRVGGPDAHFGEQEFELSKLFASQASMALQNAEAHVTVASRADLDALTGLRNHGTFQRDLQALVESGNPFSLLMMDLDSFKAYNDTFGHPAGDALLLTVAKAVVSAIRQNDRAYRYGGDEFALLLLGAKRSHAAEVTERVRAAVWMAVVGSITSPGLVVSASIGAAHWPADGLAKADLVLVADQELYEAKRQRGQPSARAEQSEPAERPTRTEADRAAGFTHGSLLEAAHEMLRASDRAEIAQATLRHAVKTAGAKDAFVAMIENASTGPSASRRTARQAMRLLAGCGAFESRKLRIRRGVGFWGRVWQEAAPLQDRSKGGGGLVGVPLVDGGQVVGLLGFVTVDDVVTHERLHQVSRLAALASAAVAASARRSEGATSERALAARAD